MYYSKADTSHADSIVLFLHSIIQFEFRSEPGDISNFYETGAKLLLAS